MDHDFDDDNLAEAEQVSSAMAEAFERAGARIETALGRAARSGELDFRRMTDAILQDLARLAAERVLAPVLVNDTQASLAGLPWFGARAEGGPVLPGGAYLVGERGPELFTPASAGQIGAVPAAAVTVNLTLPQGTINEPISETRLARQLARAVRRGGRAL